MDNYQNYRERGEYDGSQIADDRYCEAFEGFLGDHDCDNCAYCGTDN